MVNRVAPTNWGQTTVIITRREIVRVETSGASTALNRRLTASTIIHHQVRAEQMVNHITPMNWRQITIIITHYKIVRVE